jgi:hypothetical protein
VLLVQPRLGDGRGEYLLGRRFAFASVIELSAAS